MGVIIKIRVHMSRNWRQCATRILIESFKILEQFHML
jgi:hypothetical protein